MNTERAILEKHRMRPMREGRRVDEILKSSYPQYLPEQPKLSYQDQLRDAKWRKRSNQVCERDGWMCRDCREQRDLTVHHCIYIRGRLLWDYPDRLLLTLCWDCHQIRQGREEALHQAIAGILAHVPVDRIEKRGLELLGDIYPMEGKD